MVSPLCSKDLEKFWRASKARSFWFQSQELDPLVDPYLKPIVITWSKGYSSRQVHSRLSGGCKALGTFSTDWHLYLRRLDRDYHWCKKRVYIAVYP